MKHVSPGSIVLCRQTGDTRWVVESRCADLSWRIVRRLGDGIYSSRTAGAGDLTEIVPPPHIAAGTTINHRGEPHIVAAATGDLVLLFVPERLFECCGEGNLVVPGGRTISVPLSDLVLEGEQPDADNYRTG